MSFGFEIITREALDPNRQNDLLLYPPGEQNGQPSRIIPPEDEILLVRKESHRQGQVQVGFNSAGHIFLRFFGYPDVPENLLVLDSSASRKLRYFILEQLTR